MASACFFTAHGKQYPVPLRGRRTQETELSLRKQKLQYLAGFFDGDGCVAFRSDSGICVLSINQSAEHGEALLLFLEVLGGTVYRATCGQGAKVPMIKWNVTGANARKAALDLLPFSSVKKDQLQAVTAEHQDSQEDWKALDTKLKHLKKRGPLECKVCSWHYSAGFFDAEGYIKVDGTRPYITLEISQKHAEILDALYRFLQNECPGFQGNVLHLGESSRLYASKNQVTKFILRRLLDSGLSVKRTGAILALGMDEDSHLQVRDAMSAVSGNQSRFRRLDAEGCQRAHVIRKLQMRLRYHRVKGNMEMFETLQVRLLDLQHYHSLQKMGASVLSLRVEIRALLKRIDSAVS